MKALRHLTLLVLSVFSLLECRVAKVNAQSVLVPGPWPSAWTTPCYLPAANFDAMQLLFNPSPSPFCALNDAALRISKGTNWGTPWFAQLGVVDTLRAYLNPTGHWFSAFAPINGTVLRSAGGDLVLTATTSQPVTEGVVTDASIRFGTTYSSTDSSAERPHDQERMTLWNNGKLGIGTQGARPYTIWSDSILGPHPGEHDLVHLHVPTIPNTYAIDGMAGYEPNQLATLKISYG